MKWQAEGADLPKCVDEATSEYKKEMDLIAGFVEQCIEIDNQCTEKILAADLFSLYLQWAKVNHEYEMTSKKFFNEITKKLPEKKRTNRGIAYTKIRTTEYAEELQAGNRQYNFKDFH